MADKYYSCVVKIHEDDLKEFLSQFVDEDQIESSNLDDEVVEVVNGILQNDFSDFFVLGKNTIFLE